MKAFYTTILAVVWALTASAQTQLLFEKFETIPFDSRITAELKGNGWSQQLVESNPDSTKGKFILSDNGNTQRTVTVTLKATNMNKLVLNWLARKTDNSTGEIIERVVEYRVVGTTAFKIVSRDENIQHSAEWTERTATVHDDAIVNQNVEVQIRVTRTSGNKARYAVDDLELLGSFVQLPGGLAPLPVELASFNGQSFSRAAKLAWSTALEVNNDKFEVERSTDGVNFAKVGEVKGSGNSVVKRTYVFTDKAPAGGVNYYRLRQVDFDGAVSISKVVALDVAGSVAATVYPTVASNVVTISLQNTSGKATIYITDITGKTVATINSTTQQELELPVQNFKSGMYFVRVSDGENQQVQRFIKE